MRVSKADGSQVLDVRCSALLGAGTSVGRIYKDHASGKCHDRPWLNVCLTALPAAPTPEQPRHPALADRSAIFGCQ